VSPRGLDACLLAGACLVATWIATAIARRAGLVDDASDAPDRKHHRRPVPLVGGVALACALAAWVGVRGVDVVGGPVAFGLSFEARAVLLGAAFAFATGFVDDVAPGGLSPLAKLIGQTIAGVALAGGLSVDGVPATYAAQVACVFAAVTAQNAANTFDNADGALCGVAALGFSFASPFAAALIAFWPFNVLRKSGADTPRAWLGDAGSHLVGVLLLATPIAWAALVLPLADLARVIVVRVRAGHPVWRGDRRHLAHALADRGLAPVTVVLVLVALAAPAVSIAAWCAR